MLFQNCNQLIPVVSLLRVSGLLNYVRLLLTVEMSNQIVYVSM